MDVRTQTTLIAFVLLLKAQPLFGGIPLYDGNESCFWQNKALIIAKVVGTGRNPQARTYEELPNHVTLAPKLTLVGNFDCSGAGEMKVLRFIRLKRTWLRGVDRA